MKASMWKASVVAGASILALGGCSGDDTTPAPGDSGPSADTSASDTGTASDTGAAQDTGTASDAGAGDATVGDSSSDAGTASETSADGGDATVSGDAGDAGSAAADAGDAAASLTSLKHIVVIYLENHSFDNLLGNWPGADGLGDGGGIPQVGPDGGAYATLPQYLTDPDGGILSLGGQMLPNKPFDLTAASVPPSALTLDLLHRFYQEQAQINGGKMDSYVLWNNESAGQSMGYWPNTLPMAAWMTAHAQNVTVLDHFFHAAFGGSFLNHFWLVSAQTPAFANATAGVTIRLNDAGMLPTTLDTTTTPPGEVLTAGSNDNKVTPDGFAVNTTYSVNQPYPPGTALTSRLPQQTFPTIADELDSANVSWAWYAGGWNGILAGLGLQTVGTDGGTQALPAGGPQIIDLYQYHHQPFVYFKNWGGTAGDAVESGDAGDAGAVAPNGKWAVNHNLQDEKDFIAAAAAGTLPGVAFVKPLYDEHPNYTTETDSQNNTVALINDVMNGPQWNETAIIITYDENGGSWDHVAPPTGSPKADKWGPGTRVPGIVISPFAKGGVDSTSYDTTAILKLIEKRWNLNALSGRDQAQSDLSTNAMTFAK